jgi:hypothetical protein
MRYLRKLRKLRKLRELRRLRGAFRPESRIALPPSAAWKRSWSRLSQAACGSCAKCYALRFGEEPPARPSVDQLRGIEGARVRET